ncbi:LptF/LptG family permease [Candidatus Pelagibacter sp.]|nr:LptF/LptG family permease [Candidatus Pelagibacter sp.]
MKKILFRKLLLDCSVFFLITLISSSLMIWVFQAVNFLDILIEDGRDYWVYFSYTLLNLPKTLSKLLPFAFFFSFFYVISKYELNNELMIFWNFGVKKFELINFLFRCSLILLVIQIFLTAFIVPKAQDMARSYLRISNFNFFENFLKPGKFNDNIKGVTIYSDRKDENGFYYNIYLKNNTSGENIQITYANKGIFKKFKNANVLRLIDGHTISRVNNEFTNLSFSQSDVNLSDTQANTITVRKTQELSTINIIKCLSILEKLNFIKLRIKNFNDQNCNISNINNLIKEVYKRLIIPFYIPVLMLIALLLIVRSKESTNFSLRRIYVFILGFLLIIFSETTLRLIDNEINQNLKIVIIPFLLIIVLYFIFYKSFSLKSLKTAK